MKINFVIKISFFGLIMASVSLFAQSNSRWVNMTSYTTIKDISINESGITAATDNAMFIYNPNSGEFTKFSTIDGLSGEKVTAFYYHQPSGQYFLAHTNGKIEILKKDNKIFQENALFTSPLPEPRKYIFKIASHQNLLYLAMSYGITTYDMEKLEFSDTYYIGTSGVDLKIHDIIIFNNYLFAASHGQGIKYIEVDDPLKTDPTHWKQIDHGIWTFLVEFNGNLYGIKGRTVYEINHNHTIPVYTAPGTIKDIDSDNDYLYIGLQNRVIRLNPAFNNSEIFISNNYAFKLTSITAKDNKLYIGTREHGILVTPAQPPGNYTSVYPNSPLYNRPFATDTYNGNIWVVYGDYNDYYNPYPLDYLGISHYIDGRWINTPYDAFKTPTLTDVKINKQDTSQVFFGSYHSGLMEFRNGSLYKKYDSTNAPFDSIVTPDGQVHYSYRISPLLFDSDNHLWMAQGLVKKAIHQYDLQGHWQSYTPSELFAKNDGTSQMEFDRDGNLWLATYSMGVVGFNPQTQQTVMLTSRNNLPFEGNFFNTTALAIDKENVLWAGTLNGLRILRNPSRAFTDPDIQLEKIIIELEELEGQDNQGTELLLNTEITEIVVDGSNNKWIGTTGAGVFYFSPDGQQTIYRFTSQNSPLPGNSIYDIAVDPLTGLVIFSTDNGLIGFKGDATESMQNLDKAYVYPNPVLTHRHPHLIIRNLISDLNVKITDIEGNLVYETVSKGGSVRWNLRNFKGRKVASGVYLILLTDKDATHTKVLKTLIIN